MAQLGRTKVEVDRRGATLVVVGNGSPAQARAFRDAYRFDFPIYVDPSLKVYAAAGLKRSLASVLNGPALASATRALLNGHAQGLTQGDEWQQGGTFVVWPGGEVTYRHVSGFPGDNAPIADVLAALDKGPPRGWLR